MAKKVCKICGKEGYLFYPYCLKHLQQSNDFFEEQQEKEIVQEYSSIDITIEDTCLICGRETNGYHFCRECYYKFNQKEVFIKIKKCSEASLLKSAYVGEYKCADGNILKSKTEQAIDNYFYRKNKKHAYEKDLPIDENEKNDLHPDFCLEDFLGPNQDVYLEHWGLEDTNQEYNRSTEYKIRKYKELGITLICTYEKDIKNLEANLNRKLNKKIIKPNKINFLEE